MYVDLGAPSFLTAEMLEEGQRAQNTVAEEQQGKSSSNFFDTDEEDGADLLDDFVLEF